MKKNTGVLLGGVVVVLIAVIIWSNWNTTDQSQTNKNVAAENTNTANANQNTNIATNTQDTPSAAAAPAVPVKRLVIHSPVSAYSFPDGARTSFDAAGDVTGGAFLDASNNSSFIGRDLYILQQLNATIGMEVNPDAASVVFPSSMRFPTDHDGKENVTGWECGEAYMSDRDSYLLYALTEVRRGRSPLSQQFGFFGKLVSDSDAGGSYTSGKCVDVEGVRLEGRDRYLLDAINQLSVVEETVE